MIENLTRRQEQIETLLSPFSITTTAEQRSLLLQHLDLVCEKNKVINLTRIVDIEDALVRHVVDSLLFVPSIEVHAQESPRCVDIGSGAGFPGIPLTIVLGCRMALVDSVRKKTLALQEFVSELGLEERVSCYDLRAEELALKHRASFDVMTARAVADLGVLVEYASPLLAAGGILVAGKANPSEQEFHRGRETARVVGMAYVSRETYELPNKQGHREILVFRKTGKSKVKLPRRIGLAKSKPLVSIDES